MKMKIRNKYEYEFIYELDTLGLGYTNKDLLDYNFKKNWNNCNKHLTYFLNITLRKNIDYKKYNSQEIEDIKQFLCIEFVDVLKTNPTIYNYSLYVKNVLKFRILKYIRGYKQDNFEKDMPLYSGFEEERIESLTTNDLLESIYDTDVYKTELYMSEVCGLFKELRKKHLLTIRESMVCWGRYTDESYKDIGEALGLTADYVRKLHKKAEEVVKNYIMS